jgi:hypothetical protein
LEVGGGVGVGGDDDAMEVGDGMGRRHESFFTITQHTSIYNFYFKLIFAEIYFSLTFINAAPTDGNMP